VFTQKQNEDDADLLENLFSRKVFFQLHLFLI